MNRWLYRAAGTVGIAGGFLAFGAGSAQADQAEDGSSEGRQRGAAEQAERSSDPSRNPALADVFSPTRNLPPVDLTGRPADHAPDAPAATAGGLRLDPADGRTAATAPPELLPGLPGLGGGLPGLGSLPVLDSLLGNGPLRDASVGVVPPMDDLASVDGQLVGLPTDTATERAPATVPAAAQRAPEIVGPLPFLTGPLTNSLLGGRGLGDLVSVGDVAGQVPVAGPMVSQTAGSLPLVSDIVPSQQGPQPGGGQPLPGAELPGGEQLPPVIADQLADERGLAPERFGAEGPGAAEITGAVPLLGPALDPIGKMVGVGNLGRQLPLVGPLAGSALGGLPMVSDPGAAGPTDPAAADPATGDPATGAPRPDDRDRAAGPVGGERPIAGEDPDFAESTAARTIAAPAAEIVPIDAVGGLTRGELPVPLPLEMLRTLPLVGGLAGGLPVGG